MTDNTIQDVLHFS